MTPLNPLRVKPGLHIVVMVVSTVKHVSDSDLSSFDAREHFDYQPRFQDIVMKNTLVQGLDFWVEF